MRPKIRLVSSTLIVATLLMGSSARAQFSLPPGPRRPFVAASVEGGILRDFGVDAWRGLGGLSAGLGLIDNNHVINLVATAQIQGARMPVGVSAEWLSIQNGLGVSATAGIDAREHAAFAAGGVAFSVLRLSAVQFFDGRHTRCATLTLAVPLGLIVYHLVRGRSPG